MPTNYPTCYLAPGLRQSLENHVTIHVQYVKGSRFTVGLPAIDKVTKLWAFVRALFEELLCCENFFTAQRFCSCDVKPKYCHILVENMTVSCGFALCHLVVSPILLLNMLCLGSVLL